jgi:hypothetical protein
LSIGYLLPVVTLAILIVFAFAIPLILRGHRPASPASLPAA